MNTTWLRQNKLLTIFVMVFVVVFGFVGWLLWGQYGAYKEARASLSEKLGQLERLQNNNPTPTDSNVTLSDENHKRLQEAQRGLSPLVLRAAAVPHTRITSNIEFAQDLRKTIARMEDKAQKANIVIPPDFRFGFKRYATTVPSKKLPKVMLERLGKQLLVVEELVTLMIEAHVEQVFAIKRVEIEPLERGATLGEDALRVLPAAHQQEHYISMSFELQFACSAKALQDLLNRIATDDKFFVMRLLTIEQEVIEKKTDEMRGTAKETTGAQTPLDPETKIVVETPNRLPRLHVIMQLDFIEVLNPKAAARDAMNRNR